MRTSRAKDHVSFASRSLSILPPRTTTVFNESHRKFAVNRVYVSLMCSFLFFVVVVLPYFEKK